MKQTKVFDINMKRSHLEETIKMLASLFVIFQKRVLVAARAVGHFWRNL